MLGVKATPAFEFFIAPRAKVKVTFMADIAVVVEIICYVGTVAAIYDAVVLITGARPYQFWQTCWDRGGAIRITEHLSEFTCRSSIFWV